MVLTYDKVAVTGGAGFIGSHTVDVLLERGVDVWVLDDLSSGSLRNLRVHKNRPGFHFLRTDIRSYKAVRSVTRKVEGIIHLAAVVSPYVSMRRPELTNEVNVLGTLNVLRAALTGQVQRVVFASSSSVYGASGSQAVSENAPLNPITPYGASKLAAEKYCHAFYAAYDLSTISLRYFNVYGERQSSSPYSGVVAIFAQRLLKGLRPIIYGDGTQTRDFVGVSDVVSANLLALQTSRGIGQAFNIGTGHGTSLKQLHHTLSSIVGKKVLPIFKQARPGDIKHSCADITEAKRVLGFTPEVSLGKGLRLLVEYLRSREA
jgi:UDP-glucose 4-epimerase